MSEIDWNKPYQLGGIKLGELKLKSLTATVEKSASSMDSPVEFMVGIEFVDGCSCGGIRTESKRKVQLYLKRLEKQDDRLFGLIKFREKIFEQIKPLQKQASDYAERMFKIVESRGRNK